MKAKEQLPSDVGLVVHRGGRAQHLGLARGQAEAVERVGAEARDLLLEQQRVRAGILISERILAQSPFRTNRAPATKRDGNSGPIPCKVELGFSSWRLGIAPSRARFEARRLRLRLCTAPTGRSSDVR